MHNQVWLGIDIAKDSFHAAIANAQALPEHWARLPEHGFAHSRRGIQQLLSWLKNNGVSIDELGGVCLEATGRYSSQWRDFAANRMGPVSIVNPARPLGYANSLGIRDKSDRVDARVLASYGKAMRPRATPVPSKSQRDLCELSRAYQTLKVDHQAYQQRLNDGPACLEVRSVLRSIITTLKRKLLKLEEKIQTLIATDPILSEDSRRAQTIPGIGPKTIITLFAEFGDLRAYKRKELVALAGLYPREHTSGSSVKKSSRLVKTGKASVRAHLYMAAMNACRYESSMRTFADRLLANRKTPMQILGAIMRKLLLLVRALIVSETDYDPNHGGTLQLQTT